MQDLDDILVISMESAGILSSPGQIKLEQADEIEAENDFKTEDDAVVKTEDDADDKPAQHAFNPEQRARDAEQRALEAEQRALEAEQRALEAKKNAERERKLRGNYYNYQCRLKKEWDRQKVQYRIEISSLKAQIWDLRNEEKIAIKNHLEEIRKKNEQIESSEKDLNLFEAMILQRDRTIQQNESDYRTLLDDLINAKITIEDLKSAI